MTRKEKIEALLDLIEYWDISEVITYAEKKMYEEYSKLTDADVDHDYKLLIESND